MKITLCSLLRFYIPAPDGWCKIGRRRIMHSHTEVLSRFFSLPSQLCLYRPSDFDSSLIIVTSDHGQLLGEHGRLGHGSFLYDELLRVPLCIRYPSAVKASIAGSRPGFVSLTRLKPLVMELVERGQVDDGLLYSDTVFAEYHGLHQPMDEPENETQAANIRELEKYKIAIYHHGFRGIFNVADWRFDEIASCQPGEAVTAEAEAQMKSSIVRFLKAAAVPRTAGAKL